MGTAVNLIYLLTSASPMLLKRMIKRVDIICPFKNTSCVTKMYDAKGSERGRVFNVFVHMRHTSIGPYSKYGSFMFIEDQFKCKF